MTVSQPLKIFTQTEARKFFLVTGADSERFLQGMLTVDVKALAINEVAVGLLLSSKGKALSTMEIVREAESKFWLSVPENDSDKVFSFLNQYIIADDVNVVESAEYASQVHLILESPFLEESQNLKRASKVPGAKDIFLTLFHEPWGLRIAQQKLGLRDEVWWVKRGAALPFTVAPLSPAILDSARIDAGYPQWGIDYAAETLPLEFPLQEMISFFKGCYIGQEVIARATFRGHMTKVFMRFTGRSDLQKDFIYSEAEPERPVGKITTVFENRGLGLMRLAARENIAALFQLNAKGEKIFMERVDTLVNESTFKAG